MSHTPPSARCDTRVRRRAALSGEWRGAPPSHGALAPPHQPPDRAASTHACVPGGAGGWCGPHAGGRGVGVGAGGPGTTVPGARVGGPPQSCDPRLPPP